MGFNMGNNEPTVFGGYIRRRRENVLTVLHALGGDYDSRMRSSEVSRALLRPDN